MAGRLSPQAAQRTRTLREGDLPIGAMLASHILQGEMKLKYQNCVCCGAAKGMTRFEAEAMPVTYRQFSRMVHGLSGWRCGECSEVEFDPESAIAYGQVGDQLLHDAQQCVAQEMRRIRRKLNLTQKSAVAILSGGGHNAFSRYERAEVEPPKPLMVLMSLLDRHPDLVEEVKALGNGIELMDLVAAKQKDLSASMSS